MIKNGKDKKITGGGLPQVSEALLEWFEPLTFAVITKTLNNFRVQETETIIETQGVIQPMSAQEVQMKPQGQRKWKWETIHTLPNIALNVDDIIILNLTKYRIMGKYDWARYGYFEFHIVKDYENG
ncbi:MAG: hypothetical protein LBQ47_02810 [Endomicrobium sp.]|jgi:hypothetical protein|nr:hypothetical protein [Endomicrobium sp.]